MKGCHRILQSRGTWLSVSVVMILALLCFSSLSTNHVSANHPVLVEGNCDSPVPGTVLLAPSQTGRDVCGDYDGDGRIGTAEDTDGADRIFGTINAALGPGTGAAAGTGANHNGTVTIVTSGRFAEPIYIGQLRADGLGSSNAGHVTLEAAPGVDADIDAVFQGDPAGGNTARQTTGIGIRVYYETNALRTTLRNLTIRNWATGISLEQNARVTIDNCRLENNLDYGIRLTTDARVSVFNSRITATGFRVSGNVGVPTTTTFGHAISFEGGTAGSVFHSLITGSAGAAIFNASSLGTSSVRYYEVFLGKPITPGQNLIVNATQEPTP